MVSSPKLKIIPKYTHPQAIGLYDFLTSFSQTQSELYKKISN